MKNLTVRMQPLRSQVARVASVVLIVAFYAAAPVQAALAQVAPSLGTAQSFAVLGASTVTNTDSPTIVTGDLGVSPGSAVTNFPPGIVIGGTTHAADAVALQAQNDTATAYNSLASQACNFVNFNGSELGGQTLVPGVYCFDSSVGLTGTLTLDAQGVFNAVWVFKIGSTITTASNSSVLVINGGQQCNVFWQVGSSATLGTGTTFVGNILALASITLNTDAHVSGRVLARTGAVTMDSSTVAVAACAVPPVGFIPPILGKTFVPGTINAGGSSTLIITLNNPNSAVATLTAPLVDTLPAGTVATAIETNTCGGVVNFGAIVTLTGGSIPANGSCQVSVTVTASDGGSYINSLAIGALQTSNGNNVAPAVAALNVNSVNAPPNASPTLGKAFDPATVNAGAISILTITLSNPGGTNAILSLSAPLVDTLPSGMVTAGAPSNTCGGVSTATLGASTVTLTSGSIPAHASCMLTVPVKVPEAGSYFNSLAAGVLQTDQGNNAFPAVATLVGVPVGLAPTLGKVFSPSTIDAGGRSTLTITLGNPNSTVAALIAPLIDRLPNGLVVSGNAHNTCGGTLTANAGSSKVTLIGGSIGIDGSCTITVRVTAKYKGSYVNNLPVGALQTSNRSNDAPADATLKVVIPPANIAPKLSKSFSPATINTGVSSILTLTLTNANIAEASLSAPLIDHFPSGMVVSGNATNTCGGTATASVGGSTVTLTGGSIPGNSSCTVTVPVTAKYKGSYCNTLPVGALQTNKGKNVVLASATLTVKTLVNIGPKLSKAFSVATIKAGGVSTLTITLSNINAAAARLTAPLTDYFPSGMVVSGNAGNTCGGIVTAGVGGSKVTLTGGAIPANSSCTVTVRVTAKYNGSFCNTLPAGALQTDKGKNAAAAVATLKVTAHGW